MLKKQITGPNNAPRGSFLEDCAGFEINTLNLPAPWEYIYQNRDILLKLDQHGPVYAQAHPPGDIMLFKREPGITHSSWSLWFSSPQFKDGLPFSNFFRPSTTLQDQSQLPEGLKITYRPEEARYQFHHEGLAIQTVFSIPQRGTLITLRCTVKNTRPQPITFTAVPVLVPYANQAQMAPWDKYEWYLKTGVGRHQAPVFWTQLFDSASDAAKRRVVALLTSPAHLQEVEISLERLVGNGSLLYPEAALKGELPMALPTGYTFGQYGQDNVLYGYPPVYSQQYSLRLQPGEETEITQILCMPQSTEDTATLDKAMALFSPAAHRQMVAGVKAHYDALCQQNRIATGDDDFDSYVNHWLPLQLDWVASLDRGWPTGMRGTRDSAQDYTALLYLGKAKECREVLLTMLSCQRRDGWFPRQYSAKGRTGKHDLRGHVDGGAFVIEFVWMYLAHTGDFALLEEALPWLDADIEDTVLDHTMQALDYYLNPLNIGVHGLCKIREGDWLDAVNRAGLQGRGESVLVTEQTIMNARYVANILKHLGIQQERILQYQQAAEALRQAVLREAWNEKEFFSGVYTDNDQWIFSAIDPDGEERPYGPANWYAVISGVVEKDAARQLVGSVSQRLKGPCGYRLYAPPMGAKEIQCVGRAGSGDAPAYQGENGNVYNHGSQGFLARAFSVAGMGDELKHCLEWLMPYDTAKHPPEKAMSAPYAIANCWQELPLFTGRVMMTFLTGSVAMAERGVYEWMMGIKPTLSGLAIDPCLPAGLKTATVTFLYQNREFCMTINHTSGGCRGVKSLSLNGQPVTEEVPLLHENRIVYQIREAFTREKNEIVVEL